ncbi:DUF3784 domain-containing protein [Algoriphagus aestuariicola]|jgi:hypothetical protein|uniref:DUF3784 domain-containing protein n=1 Tax=Algoriphagus aestuariicola TaxID=1852016 RepID=A0ABS3BWQ2_9BACT|nr:DUF3784 domain-containing protein [Algoriphagus aestuariicola]MBN7802770.1 DUF3784 domain-containing protein [Algoriphagus aestuariicola]
MIGIAIFFLVLGALVKYGKMYFLIAGYNTMSSSEKGQFNVEAVAKVFRNGMFGMAALILIGYLAAKITGDGSLQHTLFFAAIFIGVPYLVIASNLKKHK